ncbi:MAG: hypothetical protein ACR2LY_08070 [Thermoleophilaceae bacterium]
MAVAAACAALGAGATAAAAPAPDSAIPPGPPPVPGMEIAVQDDATFVARDGIGSDAAFTRARQVGANRIRILMNWHQAVARRRGSRVRWNWRPYDRAVNEARAHGMRVQITLTGTPSYVPGGDHYLSYRRPAPRRLARFAGAVAAHFRGRVDRYAVWNEPNSAVFLSPGGACRARTCAREAGARYRALYVAGYGTVKSADPAAQVLIGETTANRLPGRVVGPLAFLREVACRRPDGAPSRPCPTLTADGYAHHPYQFRTAPGTAVPEHPDEVGLSSLPRLNAALVGLQGAGALRARDGAPLGVYVTEFGYFKPGTRRGAVPESVRARWLPQAFQLVASYGFVRQMTYYHLFETRRGVKWNSGIVRRSGQETPSFDALREWTRMNRKTLAAPAAR